MIDAAFVLLLAIFAGLEIRSRRAGAQEKLREDRRRRLHELAQVDGFLAVALRTGVVDPRGNIIVLQHRGFRQ